MSYCDLVEFLWRFLYHKVNLIGEQQRVRNENIGWSFWWRMHIVYNTLTGLGCFGDGYLPVRLMKMKFNVIVNWKWCCKFFRKTTKSLPKYSSYSQSDSVIICPFLISSSSSWDNIIPSFSSAGFIQRHFLLGTCTIILANFFKLLAINSKTEDIRVLI